MGPFWSLVQERSERAEKIGALEPIRTEVTFVEDGEMRFSIRVVESLKRKPRARAAADPFEPYDPELFVTGATERHVVLLNKYPVLPVAHPPFYNLLLTRGFVIVVPRVAERFGSISVNALGFAGALLVKDERQKRELLEAGPMAALVATAGPSRA